MVAMFREFGGLHYLLLTSHFLLPGGDRQQCGILRNGGNPDAATPRGGGQSHGYWDRKLLSGGLVVHQEEAPTNYVSAVALIRGVLALAGIIGRKGRSGGSVSRM